MIKIFLTTLIFLNYLNAESIDPQRFKKKFEEIKTKNYESGIKGEDPIRIVGKIIKIRKYNDYNVFEILTDRNEKINVRYRKKTLFREKNNINLFCKEWNIMEYEKCN